MKTNVYCKIFISIIFLQLIHYSIKGQITSWYIEGGYNFSNSGMRGINRFIDSYNLDSVKRLGFIMDKPMPHIHQLSGISLATGFTANNILFELAYTKRNAETNAYYYIPSPDQRNITYKSTSVGLGVYKNTFHSQIFALYTGAALDRANSKSSTYLSRTAQLDTFQVNNKLAITPAVIFLIHPIRIIPLSIVIKPYWQMMLSNVDFSGINPVFGNDYVKYQEKELKSSTGNIGITLNVALNIGKLFDIKITPKEKPVKPSPIELLENVKVFGNVVDAKTNKPVNAKIFIYEANSSVELSNIQTDYGYYKTMLARNKNYKVKIEAIGYQTAQDEILLSICKDNELKKDFQINAIKVGETVVLNNILFEKGKSVLLPESFKELDNLYNFLNDNSTVEIEIAGHTSSEGEYNANMKLSNDRAKAVEDYITAKGISKSRISSKGYGPDKPVAGNDTEAGRKLNRRVEFKVLKN